MHELSICIKHNFEDDMALPALRMLFVHSIQYASMIALAYTCYTIFLSLSLSFLQPCCGFEFWRRTDLDSKCLLPRVAGFLFYHQCTLAATILH